jgi:hypothetical protein
MPRTRGKVEGVQALRAYPAKVEDFCDQDLLQHIDMARFLFGKPIAACGEARYCAAKSAGSAAMLAAASGTPACAALPYHTRASAGSGKRPWTFISL